MVYRLNLNADVDMSSLKGHVVANYPELRLLFGEPIESDGYKVSGEWVFEDDNGNVFTVYDWKETELYDDNLPSVKQFRRSPEKIEFHIGGKTSAVEFLNWLEYQLAKLRMEQ